MEEQNKFTNLFQVAKTLRFELVPEEKTKERFASWIRQINEQEELNIGDNLFFKDKQIAEAYPVVKSILDKIHEDLITSSLSSEDAKKIDFSEYYNLYAKDKKQISNVLETKLREKICKTYIMNEEPYSIINKRGIIPYILSKEKETECYSKFLNIDNHKLEEHLANFKGFHTFLGGYNENRKNYYAVEDKSTAVAARIVSDNLPTFCNNIIQFTEKREEYLSIYDFLKERNIVTQIKIEKDKYKELSPIEEDVFNIDYYKYCLTQDEINNYNEKVGGYNELINLYNQQNKKENKNSTAIKEFDKLYKQIGCGKRKTWFVALKKDKENELTPEERGGKNIYSVERLLTTVKEAGENCFKDAGSVDGQIKTLPQFITFLRNCHNWDGIYWSKSAVETIYRKYFASGVFPVLLEKLYESRKLKSACITYDKKREVPIQLRDAVELSELFEALDSMESEFVFKPSLMEDEKCILNFSIKPSQNLINLICVDIEKNIGYFLEKSSEIVGLRNYRSCKDNDYKEDEIIKEIKGWFDAAIEAMRIVRYFSVRKNKMKGNVANLTMEQALTNLLRDENADWFGWYDLIRSYLTKKPQDDVKENTLRLNFGKGTLLNGFPDSITDESDNGTQYGGYLFRKKNKISGEYEYYLGISENAKLFRCHNKYLIRDVDKSEYQRLDYYQIKSNSQSLYPHNYEKLKERIQKNVEQLTNSYKDKYKEEYQNINKKGKDGKITPSELYKRLIKSENFKYVLEDDSLCQLANNVIAEIQKCCAANKKLDSINQINDNEYYNLEGLSKIIEDIQDACKYKSFSFFNVSQTEFDEHNGKDLFLFRISNKDLSYSKTYSEGKRKQKENQKENLHTLFFRALMHEDGFGDTVDIGKGQIFFRKSAFAYDEETLNKGHHYNLLKDKFSYPIISKRRFSENKYILHLSVLLNYQASGKVNVNSEINEMFGQREDLQFVGIDRGEKHLIYSCIVDKDCNIVDCKHYDNINGTDYVKKLDERANERVDAKKNWQEQEKIKDLKNGYISHVVHRLVNATIKDKDGNINPRAYIVLEDLSMKFTQGRQKIEKQTYRTLETALASKMNFIVDKDAKPGELGSVSNALQLTPLIKTYADLENKKQFGVMLYTRANYTSVTDPATGWRKTIYIRNGRDEELREQILKKFSDIGYDGKDYYFEYTEQNAGKTWRMYSSKDGVSLQRYQYKRIEGKDNLWKYELINLNEILDALFAEFDMSVSLRKQLDAGKKLKKYCDNKTAWQSLVYAINMIQQIRNNGEKDSIDDNFLLSPVRNENGVHFDTRNHVNNGSLKAIVDADANGAYNIARKGVIMQAHINIGKNKANLFVSDEEWDLWLLNREKWEKMLPEFAKPTSKSKD